MGKLPPKRTTALQQKTHRHLCRQIKVRSLAMVLNLSHPCSNLPHPGFFWFWTESWPSVLVLRIAGLSQETSYLL